MRTLTVLALLLLVAPATRATILWGDLRGGVPCTDSGSRHVLIDESSLLGQVGGGLPGLGRARRLAQPQVVDAVALACAELIPASARVTDVEVVAGTRLADGELVFEAECHWCVPQAAAPTASGAFLDGDEIMAAALAAVGSGDVLSIVRDPANPDSYRVTYSDGGAPSFVIVDAATAAAGPELTIAPTILWGDLTSSPNGGVVPELAGVEDLTLVRAERQDIDGLGKILRVDLVSGAGEAYSIFQDPDTMVNAAILWIGEIEARGRHGSVPLGR